MARKLPAFERVLGARALFGVAYGEIGASIYFALGIVAGHALGLTPWALLLTGLLFAVVALSYVEGTSAIPETGGSATLVRKAFNDLAGFMTGWVLFLDYVIVIALSALFLPHYLAGALHVPELGRSPWDVVVGCLAIAAIGLVRLFRRPGFYSLGILVAGLDLIVQGLLIVLGLALLLSTDALTSGVSLGSSPSWHAIAFALPLGMLAYTGLETVANLAEETREPGEDVRRGLFSAVGLVVVLTVLVSLVGLSAFPARGGATELGSTWLRAPLIGIVERLHGEIPNGLDDALRVFVGLSGAFVLLAAAATSMSGFGRLAYSLGEHGMLPRRFGRLGRRTLIAPESILAAVAISVGLLVVSSFADDDVAVLASLYSFGVLLAFAAAQLAVLRLRFTQPDLARPNRVPLGVRRRGVEVPVPTVVGLALTIAVFVAAMATHPAARYAGPGWLAGGVLLYVAVRRSRGEGLLEPVVSPDEQDLKDVEFSRILVPMKLGLIGEEMLATAVRLAQERGASIEAVHVIRVPLDRALDGPMEREEQAAAESLAEARLLGAEHGVEVAGRTVRARAIGNAIVQEAIDANVDLIVLGSAPRWRRQSRFFSPTVEYVLQRAPCEVIVVAFPQGVLEEDALEAR